MNLFSPEFLDHFSVEHYVAILSDIAHSDGIDPEEQEILERYADQLGVDLDKLPSVPEDMSDISWATRILIYRDVFMLALADKTLSSAEKERLATLAEKMGLQSTTTDSVQKWTREYKALLEQLGDLLESEQ